MSNKEQELVQTSNHKEPLLHEPAGQFEFGASQLKEIVDMDNRYPIVLNGEEKKSSDIIVNKLGGLQAIADGLKTNMKTGIDPKTTTERQNIYGKNFFPPPKIKSIMELILENFEDKINQILCAAAVVSIIIGLIQHPFPEGLIEGTSILIALNIIIFVNSGNNYMSEKRLADLVKLSDEQMVAVYRGSAETITINSELLVVGDLIYVESGMKVPADLVMISGQDLQTVEADLTGEPDEQNKHVITADNLQDIGTLLAKSLVVSGTGTAIVLAVGGNTASGKITEQTQQGNEPTHLQNKLAVIADKIGNIGIGCAVLTFCSMVIRTALEMVDVIPCGCGNLFTCQKPPIGTCDKPNFELNMTTNPLWGELLNTVIIAITVIVVAIPEGLPLAVTISLSFASKKMQKENNLVRTLSSAETMGGATHICSDKTGTLTENKMTVMALMAQNEVRFNTENSTSPILAKESQAATEASGVWTMLVEGLFWNSSARIEQNMDKKTMDKEPFVFAGNVTEQGIIKFFNKVMSGQECLDQRNLLSEENTCALISFTSKRKRASIVVKYPAKAGGNDEVRVYTKGAPDMIFDSCTNVMCADGSIVSFDDQTEIPAELLNADESSATGSYRDLYERTVKKFAKQAYRTILMTYKDMSMAEFEQIKADNNDFEKEGDREVLECNLTAYGIFGLQDPLREQIVASINLCRTAGIQTVMCTGDNIDTATAISLNAGIVKQEEIDRNEDSKMYSCMTGKDFRDAVGGLIQMQDPTKPIIPFNALKPEAHKANWTDKVQNMNKFKQIKEHLRVLGRSSPDDKRILVIGIQDSDGVVAVTGDGTNDAPALTKADVGFAMGITGTDVAKGACDIILLDDNFASIITALRYGRNVFDNVRKFLQFQLTVNVVAMFIVFFGSVIIKDSPLNAVQMLWVNLIMDTFAALALATEPPAQNILERQPMHKDDAIMNKVMWRNVFGHAVYQIIVLIIVIFVGQGTITANYTDECFDIVKATATPPVYEYIQCNLNQATGKKTSIYNPFYTKTLYMDDAVIKAWASITTVPKTVAPLQKSDFAPALLNEFSCFVYQQEHFEDKNTCAELQKSAEWVKNVKMPSDVKKMTGTSKLLHFTYVFQIFVFMQLFNQFNARLLEDGQFNIFAGVFKNWIFVFITVLTFAVQITMVEIGGQITKCFALNTNQNLICLAFGAFEMIWGIFLKFTPMGMWQCYDLDGKPGEEQGNGMVAVLKKSSQVQRLETDVNNKVGLAIKKKMAEAAANKRAQAENSTTIN